MSGVINSIITNSAAMVAVNSLDTIQSQLSSVQNAVSTGYSVSNAVDNGAAFAVAQSVRSDVSGLTAANQQLGDTQGLMSTTNTALKSMSDLMTSMKQTLVNLSNKAVTGNERTQYIAQYKSQLTNLQNYVKGATYNGHSVINSFATTAVYGATNVVSDGSGNNFKITQFAASGVYHKLNFTTTSLKGAGTVAGYLAAAGSFTTQMNTVGSAMNTYGNLTNQIDAQITFNQSKIDALNNGLGALVDANMTQESAKLQSLQIQQQLATSALSIADQAPALLTKLF